MKSSQVLVVACLLILTAAMMAPDAIAGARKTRERSAVITSCTTTAPSRPAGGRNKSATEKQGLFASHPEMKERIDRLAKLAAGVKPAGTATLEERYRKYITYTAKPQAEIAGVEAGAAGLAGASAKSDKTKDEEKKEEPPKKKGFSLGSLMKPTGSESKSAEVTGSGASRGVDTERNAKGGSNPKIVAVNIQMADTNALKKEGGLR